MVPAYIKFDGIDGDSIEREAQPTDSFVFEKSGEKSPAPMLKYDSGEHAGDATGGWGMAQYQYGFEGDYGGAADDVIVDGTIITAENFDAVEAGGDFLFG